MTSDAVGGTVIVSRPYKTLGVGPSDPPHTLEAVERGHEAGPVAPSEDGRGPDPRYKIGRDCDGNLPEPGAGRHQGGRDSGRSGHWRGRSHRPEREAGTEKSMEPAPKPVDLDLGM